MLFVGLSIGETRQNSAQSSNEAKEVFCLVVAFPLSGSEIGKKSSGIERSSFRQNRLGKPHFCIEMIHEQRIDRSEARITPSEVGPSIPLWGRWAVKV